MFFKLYIHSILLFFVFLLNLIIEVNLTLLPSSFRYVALNMLMKAVTADGQAVQRHRATILECVKVLNLSSYLVTKK